MTVELKPTNIAEQIWYEDWKFCGCGCPEHVLQHIRTALTAMKLRWEDKSIDYQKEMAAIGHPNNPLYYMTCYLMDVAGLTEHGGAVPGWPTKKGLELLKFLDETDEDDWLTY